MTDLREALHDREERVYCQCHHHQPEEEDAEEEREEEQAEEEEEEEKVRLVYISIPVQTMQI